MAVVAATAVTEMKGIEFYSTAAQVLPIFVLVIAIELRWFRIWFALGPVWKGLMFAPAALMAVAEFRALRVLQTEHAASYDSSLVWAGLYAAVGTIAGIIIGQAVEASTTPSHEGS